MNDGRVSRWPPSPFWVFRLSLLATVVAFAAAAKTETDIWGHLRFGLDILATRSIPQFDSYSFTTDQNWVNHEWLAQVLFALMYSWGGLPLLTALRAANLVFLIASLDRQARSWSWPWCDLLVTAVVVAAIPQLNAVRPQLFSVSLYAATLLGISTDRWWVPLIFVPWANLHGGWLLGLGAVGVRAACAPSRYRFLTVGACALATLVNPYGVKLWTSLWSAIGRGWADVSEWTPITRLDVGPGALLVWVVIVAALAWAFPRASAGRFAWIWTIIVGLAGFRSRRLVGFFALTVAMLVMPHVRTRAIIRWPSFSWTREAFAIVLVVIGAAGLSAYQLLRPSMSCLPSLASGLAPEASTVQFIGASGINGRVLMWFDWGLYAIWHVGDRLRVSIDNRRETVYSAAVVTKHHAFYAGNAPDYPDQLGVDYVWVPVTLSLVKQLEERGWHSIFRGPRSVILSRVAAPPTSGSESPGRPCFPYP